MVYHHIYVSSIICEYDNIDNNKHWHGVVSVGSVNTDFTYLCELLHVIKI